MVFYFHEKQPTYKSIQNLSVSDSLLVSVDLLFVKQIVFEMLRPSWMGEEEKMP